MAFFYYGLWEWSMACILFQLYSYHEEVEWKMCIVFACDPHKNQQPTAIVCESTLFLVSIPCMSVIFRNTLPRFMRFCVHKKVKNYKYLEKRKRRLLKLWNCSKYLQSEKIGMAWYWHRYTLKSWNIVNNMWTMCV